MPSEQQRILELALESLANKKRMIEQEIADLTAQLKRGRPSRSARLAAGTPTVAAGKGKARKRPRFTKEERQRRAARMKAYWDKWRKDKARQK